MIEAAANLSVTSTVHVLGLVTRLKDFIRTDSMIELSERLREACLKVSLQEDSAEAKKLGKKDIIDFTENLERVLLNAYNATKPPSAVVSQGPDVPNVDPTDEEKAAEEARKAVEGMCASAAVDAPSTELGDVKVDGEEDEDDDEDDNESSRLLGV